MFGADGGAEALHDEYLAATLKKVGLPEHSTVEMRLEYGIEDTNGDVWLLSSRAEAESAAEEGDTVVVHEVITTAWRKTAPRA